jgi:hypothetical protein
MTTTYPPRSSGVPAPEDETDRNRHEHFFNGRDHPRDVCGDWCAVQELAPLPVPETDARIDANLAAQRFAQEQASAVAAARAAEQARLLALPSEDIAGVDSDSALQVGHLLLNFATAIAADPETAKLWQEMSGASGVQDLTEAGNQMLTYSHRLDSVYVVDMETACLAATAADRADRQAAALEAADYDAAMRAQHLEEDHDN